MRYLAVEGKPLYFKRMEFPDEAPVMTLPNVTLFPQALMRLRIFEPRYRRMLEEVLHGGRVFAIAMRKPGSVRETPLAIAGLGLVRVCVKHRDGTSALVVEGLGRVELVRTLRLKPFRVSRIRPLPTPERDSVAIDALVARIRDLVTERIAQELPTEPDGSDNKSAKDIVACLERMDDPARVADLVSWSLLSGAEERQTILETVEVEPRLKSLIRFLMAEIDRQRKSKFQ